MFTSLILINNITIHNRLLGVATIGFELKLQYNRYIRQRSYQKGNLLLTNKSHNVRLRQWPPILMPWSKNMIVYHTTPLYVPALWLGDKININILYEMMFYPI